MARKTTTTVQPSLLTKRLLEVELRARNLVIEPILDPEQIDEVGVDLRLDNFFGEFRRTAEPYLSPAKEQEVLNFVEKEFYCGAYYIQPGEFILAKSLEYISIPNYLLGVLNGKSSLGRRGLLVHATANLVDPGWRGHVVFELANLGRMPIELIPLMKIARIIFFRTAEAKPYTGKFSGQVKIIPPYADPKLQRIKNHLLQEDTSS